MTKDVFLQRILNPELLAREDVPLLKKLTDDYPYCHIARMLYLRALYNTQNFTFQRELSKNAVYIPSRTALFELINQIERKGKVDGISYGGTLDFQLPEQLELEEWIKKERLKQNIEEPQEDLIEKFIKQNPKIRPKITSADGTGENEDLAEASLRQEGELMTETLARLLEKQGKFDRAIKAYEILSLKYPKKSSIFALRIEELKKQIENN